MADRMVVMCLAAVGLVSVVASSPTPPPYIECVDSADCGKDECCTIGSGRFTIPVCRKTLDVDETCRRTHDPFSTTVVYPDGNAINLTNVYHTMCPCMSHLACSSETSTCVDHVDLIDNYIDNYIDQIDNVDNY